MKNIESFGGPQDLSSEDRERLSKTINQIDSAEEALGDAGIEKLGEGYWKIDEGTDRAA